MDLILMQMALTELKMKMLKLLLMNTLNLLNIQTTNRKILLMVFWIAY